MSIVRRISARAPVLALAALFALPLAAQQQAGEASDLLQRVQQKQQQIQQLNQQLGEIQQATIEANPELADKRDALMADVDEKMAEAGHDAEASRDRIEDLQGELDSGELSQQESQSVSQELRQEQTSLRQAQGQAMQSQEIQTRLQTLNEELIAAMREQNPQTDDLISQLRTAQQEYQQLMQEAMQKHGGSDPTQR